MNEGIELKTNGHVVMNIDGVSFDCRRPKAKEYFALTEAVIAMGETLQNMDTEGKTEAESSMERLEKSIEVSGNWFIQMIDTLCETKFPGTPDDLPPWIIGDASSQIVAHWITVPLDHPGR